MARTRSRAPLLLAALAGFAAGWFARDLVRETPPSPVDAGPELAVAPPDAGPPPPVVLPAPPEPDDRVAAITWWATAPASPDRERYEASLRMPAGVGFFDYLTPVFERSAFEEAPDGGEPAALGYFTDRTDGGRTCRYLAGRVPVAQGGLRVGRACDELTTTAPRWLAIRRESGSFVLFDVDARRVVDADEPPGPPLPTLLFGLSHEGRAGPRTGTVAGLLPRREGEEGLPRRVNVPQDIGELGVSEVRPLAVERRAPTALESERARATFLRLAHGRHLEPTVVSDTVLSSPWLDFSVEVVRGESPPVAVFVPISEIDDAHATLVAAAPDTALAVPGPDGYFLFARALPDGSFVQITCDSGTCAASTVPSKPLP